MLTNEAQAALTLLRDHSGAQLRLVDTYDRGLVAQVVQHGSGLLIAPASIVDELMAEGLIEVASEHSRFVVVDERGNKTQVDPTDMLINSSLASVTPVADTTQVYQPVVEEELSVAEELAAEEPASEEVPAAEEKPKSRSKKVKGDAS